jgi:hypothetical protein
VQRTSRELAFRLGDPFIFWAASFETAFVEFVVEGEHRVERADVAAVMRRQLFPGQEFRLAVAIQIGQSHGVKRGYSVSIQCGTKVRLPFSIFCSN